MMSQSKIGHTITRRLRRTASTLLLSIAISATELDGRMTVKRDEEVVLIMPKPRHYPPRALPWRMRWSVYR